ncbi:hypothetical protein [uncultured Thiodictyon sp.]|uniref:hypothetical protein n=1 Tax=uncultured Thiodictyon sp. TaxID=1846217 RepID=UPI0025D62AA3|nr:hypothetical protein [uncultured Thiodictyon sp.]
MQAQIQSRLAELKADFSQGNARLRDLESQAADLRQTLLRIAGAIQVLEELLGSQPAAAAPGDSPPSAAGD